METDVHVGCEGSASCQPENTTILARGKTSKECPGVSLTHTASMKVTGDFSGVEDKYWSRMTDSPHTVLRDDTFKTYCNGGNFPG